MSATEVRPNVSAVLDFAEHGETILVTRGGEAVATIAPAPRATGAALPADSRARFGEMPDVQFVPATWSSARRRPGYPRQGGRHSVFGAWRFRWRARPGPRHDRGLCKVVTLGSQEGEGAVAVAMDRFGRFFDFVQAIEAEESECEVAQCCHGVWSVSDPGLVVVLSPGGVWHVVAFVLDSPVLAYVGVQVGRAGVFGGGLVMMRANSLLSAVPSRANSSRRMQPSWAAWGKSIPVASVIQVDHRLIRP